MKLIKSLRGFYKRSKILGITLEAKKLEMREYMEQKLPLIILTGPTAVGKTNLSIQLAKAINGEIISADSCQVYQNMDIGSAKITKEEMQGVTHHLIDICKPDDPFNVAIFQQLAKEKVREIVSRGHIPIVVGGTGFYIQALLYDIDFTKTDDDSVRRDELEQLAKEKGAEVIHQMLQKVDPVSAETIHANNVKRVIRAIVYYEQTKTPISEHNEEQRQNESAYDSHYFVLNDDRAKMYERIDKRVDEMIQSGLVEEVKSLKEAGYTKGLVSMQAIGYHEVMKFLEGEYTLEDAISEIKKETRHFAKRQLTWFRREKEVKWIMKPDFSYDDEAILAYIIRIIKGN